MILLHGGSQGDKMTFRFYKEELKKLFLKGKKISVLAANCLERLKFPSSNVTEA